MREIEEAVSLIQSKAKPFRTSQDISVLARKLGNARVVMLGEASHGTHEFYDLRRELSLELLKNHGFNFISVEGDWPPCFHLNNFVRSQSTDLKSVLQHFHRWPTWMWDNQEVYQLALGMQEINRSRADDDKVGFFGLDVYSFFESISVVLERLRQLDVSLYRKANMMYGCFHGYLEDNEKAYARSLMQFPEGCKREAISVLNTLLQIHTEKKNPQEEAFFDALQNSRIVANAENYYRTMILGDEDSWNVRDRHMMETLEVLLSRYGEKNSKAIVWAHNTHIGDYRATSMKKHGQINIGGLARELLGEDQVKLVGFGTYEGEVIASHAWDGDIEIMPVPPAKPGSYDDLLHQAAVKSGLAQFWVDLDEEPHSKTLEKIRGQRAIGVVYHPALERYGNYVPTQLSRRYNAFVFVDRTSPLSPLDKRFVESEIPETFPSGL